MLRKVIASLLIVAIILGGIIPGWVIPEKRVHAAAPVVLSQNKPVTGVDAFSASNPASYVNDGSLTTYYRPVGAPSTSNPIWVEIDLGDVYDLTGVDFTGNSSGRYYYYIEASTDHLVYTEIANRRSNLEKNTVYNSVPAGTKARYVRLKITGNDNGNANTKELRVYGYDTTPPAKPVIKQADQEQDQISLTWDATADNAVGTVSYAVYRDNAKVASNITSLTYVDTGLQPMTAYQYKIVAADASGNISTESDIFTASTTQIDTVAPSSPVLSVQSFNPAYMELSWTPAIDNNKTVGYAVYCNGTMIAGMDATNTIYVHKGISPGVTYHYYVKAYDHARNSAISNIVDTQATTAGYTAFDDFTVDSTSFARAELPKVTSSTKGTWTVSNGRYNLTAPAASVAGVSLSNISLYNSVFTGDFTVSSSVYIVSNTGNSYDDATIVFGYLDADNYCFISLCESNDAGVNGVFKVLGGVQTEITDFAKVYPPNNDYLVDLIRSGTNTIVRIDGIEVANINEDLISDGKIGFGSKNDSAQFDNFAVKGTIVIDNTSPTVPQGFRVGYVGPESINIKWDAPVGETGIILYKVFKGTTQIATTTETSFTELNLPNNTSYSYYIQAIDISGNSSANTSTITATTLSGVDAAFPFDQGNIDLAVAEPLLWYEYFLEWSARPVMSTAAFFYLTEACTYDPYHQASDGTVIKDRVLAHIRKLISEEEHIKDVSVKQPDGSSIVYKNVVYTNEPSFSGQLDTEGYGQAILALAMIKEMPVIWDALTTAEKNKITLMMQAALVAANWAHDKDNNFNCGILQDYNFNKAWNPNFVEGAIGAAIASVYYLGGAEKANEFLRNFDYDTFLSQLDAAHLKSATWTFRQAGKAKLEDATKNKGDFTYEDGISGSAGISMGQMYDVVAYRAKKMYSETVSAVVYQTKNNVTSVVATTVNPDGLPNVGQIGMAKEFNTVDAEGVRSEIDYVYNGWKNSIANRLFLETIGKWKGNNVDQIENLYNIGSTDLLYKAKNGYNGYAHAASKGVKTESTLEPIKRFYLVKELWLNLLAPSRPTLPVAGVNLDQTEETILLGDTFQLSGKVEPVKGTFKNLVWESSRPAVATVSSDGMVTAVGQGETTITASVYGTVYSDTCNITVLIPVNEKAVAIAAAINAITALPAVDSIALTDKTAVVATRALVTTAKTKGAVDADITNLSTLIDAEAKLTQLETVAAEKEAAITAATNAITALPATDSIALTDKTAVVAARALVTVAKTKGVADADITNLSILVETEERIGQLELTASEKAAAIDAAINAIITIPAVNSITLTDKAAIIGARGLVDTAKTKGAVDADITNLSILVGAEAKIGQLEAAASEKSAAISAAIEAINALPSTQSITLTNKPAIVAARALVATAKTNGAVDADITNLSTLVDAEAKIKQLEAAPTGGSSSSTAPVDPLKPIVDSNGNGQVNINSEVLNGYIAKAVVGKDGVKKASLEIPKTESAKTYEIKLPVSYIASTGTTATQTIEIKTEKASIVIPNNMLTLNSKDSASVVSISIGRVEGSQLNSTVGAQIGNHPVVELNLKVDGKPIAWSNPDATVKVTLPYTPTAEELKNPEHIVVWYIDDAGKAVSIPSGRYYHDAGGVTFKTTHFSKYAIGYVVKTFGDMDHYTWAKNQVEVLASKGIINGTSETDYTPEANVSRGDFLMLLIKSLGLTAKVDSNFRDVSSSDYYYEAIGIAKKIGITQGVGNNLFDPTSPISRQEMMTLSAKAMKIAGILNMTGSSSDLDRFNDKSEIADYAVESIQAMVKEGIIKGDGSKMNPISNATRAEAAVLIYGIYNRIK